ncbi:MULTISPECIES: DUF1120 domain-containing protein [Pseudomonas]|uniref:DUF1120 domain-containing protein n=1 Tax=Pseudomonas canadensis TaxID=915099 RepID=A0ABZ1ABB9_9PSED|nr:DUF1120 domain-containing protein [Pseudomonas canadensis]MCF5169438.1 DUF1120 domain-containing protein [Pseudomonas canadensis]WRI25846.1 DUF1120 domain-containing protein [Pseudomonas canadensis]
MKKSLAALTAVFTLAGSGMTFAASTTELTVTGMITPSACTPSLSGNVNYGKISIKDLDPNTPTHLDPITIRLNVLCDAATLIALRGTDNRSGSSTILDGYGLGLTSNNVKIGNFTLSLENAVADNVDVTPLQSSDNGQNWQVIGNAIWQGTTLAAFGIPGNPQPTMIQNLNTDIVVIGQIDRAMGFPSEETPIDGLATIEVVYL